MFKYVRNGNNDNFAASFITTDSDASADCCCPSSWVILLDCIEGYEADGRDVVDG